MSSCYKTNVYYYFTKNFIFFRQVLQNCNSVDTRQPQKGLIPTSTSNGKILTKRRASIATFTQPKEVPKNKEVRKIIRRTSEIQLGGPSRNIRPNRLE